MAVGATALPLSAIARVWVAGVNQLIAREPWAGERLAPFCGRAVRVAMAGGHGFTVAIDARGRLSPAKEPPGRAALDARAGAAAAEGAENAGPAQSATADAQVDFAALMKTALGPAGREDLAVEGDPELAQTIRFIAAHLRWDAEEDIARLFGNIAANRIVRTARAARTVTREGADRLAANVSEYLTEEGRWVLGRSTFAGFGAELKLLESAVDAVAARLAALERRRRPS